jgi:hypothetical protein
MKHVIEIFDKETEELLKTVEVPPERKSELADLMGWKAPEDEIYGYDLTSAQLRVLEVWTKTQFSEAQYIIQLACIA